MHANCHILSSFYTAQCLIHSARIQEMANAIDVTHIHVRRVYICAQYLYTKWSALKVTNVQMAWQYWKTQRPMQQGLHHVTLSNDFSENVLSWEKVRLATLLEMTELREQHCSLRHRSCPRNILKYTPFHSFYYEVKAQAHVKASCMFWEESKACLLCTDNPFKKLSFSRYHYYRRAMGELYFSFSILVSWWDLQLSLCHTELARWNTENETINSWSKNRCHNQRGGCVTLAHRGSCTEDLEYPYFFPTQFTLSEANARFLSSLISCCDKFSVEDCLKEDQNAWEDQQNGILSERHICNASSELLRKKNEPTK